VGNLPPWQPAEPLVPAVIAARLDQIGWTADRYRLESFSRHHALITYRTVFEPHLILSLDDGHEVAGYRTLPSARDAFRLICEAEKREDDDREAR
jgi:hypothetical protein